MTAIPFGPERLRGLLSEFRPARRWWVALSGGADSTALLHALSRLRPQLQKDVLALHVDHSLHPNSGAWSKHCARLCAQLDIPLHAHIVRVRMPSAQGLEAEARAQRYAIAERLLERGDVLLTAHHARDQAETVLLHLVRGSGVDGVAGIPPSRPLGAGTLARPLLAVDPVSLRDYLKQQGVPWIEDTSNQDVARDRNFIRHRVLPLLMERWPHTEQNLALSARLCRDASGLVAKVTKDRLQDCLRTTNVLDLRRLARSGAGDDADWVPVIRAWLDEVDAPPPPRARLDEFRKQLNGDAVNSGHCCMEWSGWRLGHYRDCLWLHRLKDLSPCPETDWHAQAPLRLGGCAGTLSVEPASAGAGLRFRVRPRTAGDRIAGLPGGRHKSAKNILQTAGIPPWMRTCVPVLTLRGEPVALADLCLSESLSEQLLASGGRLRWRPGDPGLAHALSLPPDQGG